MESTKNKKAYYNRIASIIMRLCYGGAASTFTIGHQLQMVARDQRYASIDAVNAMDIPDDIKAKVTMVIHNSSIQNEWEIIGNIHDIPELGV